MTEGQKFAGQNIPPLPPPSASHLMDLHDLGAMIALLEGLAHSFNNNLGAIMGNAEVAAMDLQPEHPARPAMMEVLQSSRRARDLIRAVLTLTQKQSAAPAVAALDLLVGQALTLLAASLPAGLEIERDLEPHLPHVKADPGHIVRLILHVGLEAAKSVDRRQRRIAVTLSRKTLNEPSDLGRLQISEGSYLRLTFVSDATSQAGQGGKESVFKAMAGSSASLTSSDPFLWKARQSAMAFGGSVDRERSAQLPSRLHIYFPVSMERQQ